MAANSFWNCGRVVGIAVVPCPRPSRVARDDPPRSSRRTSTTAASHSRRKRGSIGALGDVRGEEEHLAAAVGDDAARGRVAALDRVGAVQLGLHARGQRAAVHARARAGRAGCAGSAPSRCSPGCRAPTRPVAGVAQPAGPRVAPIVRQVARPAAQRREPQRPAEQAGEDVALQRLDGRRERPLVADHHEPAGAVARVDRARVASWTVAPSGLSQSTWLPCASAAHALRHVAVNRRRR